MKKRKLGRKLLSFLLTLAMVVGLMPGMGLTALAADNSPITVTWSSTGFVDADFDGEGKCYGKDGVSLSGTNISNDSGYEMSISADESSFTTTIGNFTKIEVSGEELLEGFTGTGWSGDGRTWTGNTSSVAFNGYLTDSSHDNPWTITFTIDPVYKSVTIHPGNNMTKTTSSGAASQTDLAVAMTDVVYTANNGYYFPKDYSVAAVNGITVTRNSYTQITVSGMPTANAEITLTAPMPAPAPAAPTKATETLAPTITDGKITATQVLHYAGKEWYVIASGDKGVQIASDAVTRQEGETTIVLLARELWGSGVYGSYGDYNNSTLKTTIEGFVTSEKIGSYYTGDNAWQNDLIAKRTLAGGGTFGNSGNYTKDNIMGDPITDATLWLLSGAEALQMFNFSTSRDTYTDAFGNVFGWFLRNPGQDSLNFPCTVVLNNVESWTSDWFLGAKMPYDTSGVRPALCLNLTDNILASETFGGSGEYTLMLSPHQHAFTYTTDGATITATCSADGCLLPSSSEGGTDHVATLTLTAPTLTTVGGTGSASASLDGLTVFNTATGLSVSAENINYVGRDGTSYDESTTAPTVAGKYTAKITLSGVKTSEGENKSVTASVDYEIAAPYESPYTTLVNTTTEITFDGKLWYLIEDTSTAANDGTVTLLSKECVATSKYNSSGSYVEYASSTVKTAVDNWYNNHITGNAKTAVVDNKMFLLTKDQADAMTEDTRKCSKYNGEDKWWLCSPGDSDYVAGVNGYFGEVISDFNAGSVYCVRPALQLDLSKVTFDSESKTFSLAEGEATATAAETLAPTVDVDNDNKVTEAKILEYAGKQWYVIASDTTGVQIANDAVTPQTGKTTLVLLAKDILANQIQFNSSYSNVYKDSALYSKITELEAQITAYTYGNDWEKNLIAKRKLAGEATSGENYQSIDNISGGTVDEANLWPLSAYEAGQLSPTILGTDIWWLRSPGDSDGSAACVSSGDVTLGDVVYELGVRPALCLNLTSDIFASEKSGESGVYELTKAEPAIEYPLWVGGTQVTSENVSNIDGDNKASYDDSTHTLTLNGYNLTVSNEDPVIEYGIKYTGSDPLTINLEGENAIEGFLNYNKYRGINYGIYITRDTDDIAADVTFTGEGSLSVKAKRGIVSYTKTNSDDSVGNITFSGTGEIDVASSVDVDGAICTNYGTVNISGGTLTAAGYTGIEAQKGINISGGTVSVTGTSDSGMSSYNPVSITGGTVTAIGETKGISASWSGEGDTVTIGANVKTVVISGEEKAVDGKVMNAIAGSAWVNKDGTGNKSEIEASSVPRELSEYKKMVFSSYIPLDTTETNLTPINISIPNSHTVPAVGDVLEASCAATDIVYQWYRGTTLLIGETNSSYTATISDIGKTLKVVVKQTKQANGTEYSSGSEPTLASEETGAVVKKTPATLSVDDAKTNAGISYMTETVTPDTGYEVSSSGTANIAITSLTDILNSEGVPVIYVRTAETSDTAAGDWVAVTLTARPIAPTGLTTEKATNGSTANGKISGVDTTMEYSADGTSWTDVTGGTTIEGLTPGTYQVRVKATANVPHGRATEVTVGSKQIILTDSQKPTAKTGLTYTGSEQALINAPTVALPEGATEMRYAIGTDATTAPTDGWSTSIPTGTEAKTYYVWYKVVGDENHSDTTPACVTVNISQYIPPHYHSYTSTVTKEATCTEAGERTYRCSCGSSYKETIKATGHTIVAHEAKEASCGEDGNKAYWECSVCEKIFADKDAKTETALDEVTIKATGEHTLTSHKAVDVTCTEDGSKAYWECSVCKKLYSDAEAKTETTLDETVIKAKGHKLTAHEAKDVTCTEDGNKAYWECSECKKLFADAEGKKEITETEIVIKAEGHKLTRVEAVEATTEKEGNIEYWTCSKCGKYFADAEGKTEITKEQTVLPKSEHKLTLVPEKKATCTEDGNKAYYTCSHCDKLFEDATGTKEIKLEDTVIKAEGHKLTHVEAKEATVEEEGNIEYWVCSECGKLFSDAEGKSEITEDETKVEKLIDISKATVTGLGIKAWTGSAVKPVVTVKLDGKTLKKGTDYTVSYSNNKNAGKATVTIEGMGTYAGTLKKTFVIKKPVLKYRAYVQKKGWMNPWTVAGIGTKVDERSFAGTTDNLRMETIQMQLSGIGGQVQYRAYCRLKGWTQWATTADTKTYAGTKGEARRVEMIQLKASGQIANLYDMYYRTYCEKFGWLGWTGNNGKSGSAGYARKLEAFQIQFVPKGTDFDTGDMKSFYDKTKDGEQ